MIVLTWPAMLILLIPIIFAEAAFIARRLSLPIKTLLWPSAAANAASTIIGVPLAWGVLMLCEMGLWEGIARTKVIENGNWNSPLAQVVTTILSAPWLAPADKSAWWAIPLAALVLLVPFFFVSVWSERWVVGRFFNPGSSLDPQRSEQMNPQILRKAVRDANLMSYGFLFALAVAWLTIDIVHH
jgi:hypothetical protein